MGEEPEKKKRLVLESLGWLTESSIMPKKHRAISGVGASSIVELKAQLYKSQEETKKSKELTGPVVEYHRAKKKMTPLDPFSAKNTGVDARSHKDKLELIAERDGSASYAALERKAALYEKLVKGELSDEEDAEKYCVDFFRKGINNDVSDLQQNHDRQDIKQVANEDVDNDTFSVFNTKPLGLGRTTGSIDKDEHIRFVREVHEEASQAREKTSEIKMRRQEQAAARREKLKQEYLRKKLERLKAASTMLDTVHGNPKNVS